MFDNIKKLPGYEAQVEEYNLIDWLKRWFCRPIKSFMFKSIQRCMTQNERDWWQKRVDKNEQNMSKAGKFDALEEHSDRLIDAVNIANNSANVIDALQDENEFLSNIIINILHMHSDKDQRLGMYLDSLMWYLKQKKLS